MAAKGSSGEHKARSSMSVFIIAGLCCFFYILGAWQRSGFGKGDSIALEVTKQADCSILSHLNYVTPQEPEDDDLDSYPFNPCDENHINHTPCQDPKRAFIYPEDNAENYERHCPSKEEKLRCLIPAPKGYRTPFPWPKSRDYVPSANVPYKSLMVESKVQNGIQYADSVFKFTSPWTQFPHNADAYIDQLASMIPLDNGTVRTALDTGCGFASFGAYLFKKNAIAMSFAPADSREAPVQFALERGVPAVIGVLGTIKLPYPSRAFDVIHCYRCSIPWDCNDGMYMMEIDRVLRPGGYWVLSGPPINWQNNYQTWQHPEEELEEAKRKIEEIADLLCWEKKHEIGEIAVWRKQINYHHCHNENTKLQICDAQNIDDIWYQKMEACVTPYPEMNRMEEVAVGELKPFPNRLNSVPPRILSGSVPRESPETFMEDSRLWRKHVNAYRRTIKILVTGRYRNIMDMNAGLGGFAAALEAPKLWVMNVVPTASEKDTLGVIYDRGLIGIYHDWCEAFSTYPRTYDLIHAYRVFTLYKDKCDMEDILLEMDRILRPEGAVIFRDQEELLNKVRRTVKRMRWKTKMMDHEDGPLHPEKVLFAVKQYWVVGEVNTPLSR